jgi:hypothetical protein
MADGLSFCANRALQGADDLKFGLGSQVFPQIFTHVYTTAARAYRNARTTRATLRTGPGVGS